MCYPEYLKKYRAKEINIKVEGNFFLSPFSSYTQRTFPDVLAHINSHIFKWSNLKLKFSPLNYEIEN
jgi:hypothetical protein